MRYDDTAPGPGDSGAAILSGLHDGASCWGVHGGKVKIDGELYDWFSCFDSIGREPRPH